MDLKMEVDGETVASQTVASETTDGKTVASDVTKQKFSGRRRTLSDVPEYNEFNNWTIFFTMSAVIGSVVNLATDVAATKVLSDEGNQIWFTFTLVLTVVPRVIANIFSFYWYWHDCPRDQLGRAKRITRPNIKQTWIIRALTHICLQGPMLRYFDFLSYGFKARKLNQRKPAEHLKKCDDYYTMFVDEDHDTNLLELIQGLLGDALQLVLQIYILAVRPRKDYNEITIEVQLASIFMSLFTLAASVSSYHRALRFKLPHKKNLSGLGSLFQFFWRLGTLSARLVTFALFASVYNYWILAVIGVHWGIMMIWISWQKTNFCTDYKGNVRCFAERIFNVVMAGVLVTCYITLKEGDTRYKCLFYYTLELVENGGMILFWYLAADPNLWYHIPAFVGTIASFAVGILFMITYYLHFHPNGKMPKLHTIAAVL